MLLFRVEHQFKIKVTQNNPGHVRSRFRTENIFVIKKFNKNYLKLFCYQNVLFKNNV